MPKYKIVFNDFSDRVIECDYISTLASKIVFYEVDRYKIGKEHKVYECQYTDIIALYNLDKQRVVYKNSDKIINLMELLSQTLEPKILAGISSEEACKNIKAFYKAMGIAEETEPKQKGELHIYLSTLGWGNESVLKTFSATKDLIDAKERTIHTTQAIFASMKYMDDYHIFLHDCRGNKHELYNPGEGKLPATILCVDSDEDIQKYIEECGQ